MDDSGSVEQRLALVHHQSEDIMDFSQMTAAHRQSQNQLRFDLEGYERAALKRDLARNKLRSVWLNTKVAVLGRIENSIALSKLFKTWVSS